MPLPIQKFREAVFQILYSHEFADEKEEIISFMMHELKTTKKAMQEAMTKVGLIQEKLSEIDPLIAATSSEYSFDRISRVEKTILRLALFELLFESKTPAKVAIAEAVRLCRKFGTPESSHFVNAILDAIYKAKDQ